MKKKLRVLLYLVLIVVVLVAGTALFIQLRGIPSFEAKDPGTIVKADSQMVQEGKRIASMLCAHRHFNPATNSLTGRNLPEVASFGTIYSANITQDRQFGIGNYTDGQLLYLLRTGVKPEGSFMPPYMPKFVHMSDKDLHGIVAWLGEIVVSDNLTPDPETGIGGWWQEQFINTLKYGKRPDGRMNRMPMAPYAATTDLEARSVFAYLNTLKPVKNRIDAVK